MRECVCACVHAYAEQRAVLPAFAAAGSTHARVLARMCEPRCCAGVRCRGRRVSQPG
jgi:hypothetical protein